MRGLRRAGFLLGRRVLITGATGAVGRFAIQLAAMSGAHVIAVATPAVDGELRKLGAAELVERASDLTEPVFAALDVVGGQTLTEAYAVLDDPGGTLVSMGHAARTEERFDSGAMLGRERTIAGFFLFADTRGIGADMAILADLVHRGRLKPHIGWRGDWHDADAAVSGLLTRELRGKAVLDITSTRSVEGN